MFRQLSFTSQMGVSGKRFRECLFSEVLHQTTGTTNITHWKKGRNSLCLSIIPRKRGEKHRAAEEHCEMYCHEYL